MSRRWVLLVGFAALAAVLGIAGFVLGADLALWKAQRYVDQIAIADPRQVRGIQITTALLFAWPALVAGMACAIHRWRRDEEPSNRMAIIYFAIPFLVIGGMHLARWLFFPMPPAGSTLMLLTFAPGAMDAQLAALTAIVLWLYLGVRRSG